MIEVRVIGRTGAGKAKIIEIIQEALEKEGYSTSQCVTVGVLHDVFISEYTEKGPA
jgi:nucleoside-triphosphatase THEP1